MPSVGHGTLQMTIDYCKWNFEGLSDNLCIIKFPLCPSKHCRQWSWPSTCCHCTSNKTPFGKPLLLWEVPNTGEELANHDQELAQAWMSFYQDACLLTWVESNCAFMGVEVMSRPKGLPHFWSCIMSSQVCLRRSHLFPMLLSFMCRVVLKACMEDFLFLLRWQALAASSASICINFWPTAPQQRGRKTNPGAVPQCWLYNDPWGKEGAGSELARCKIALTWVWVFMSVEFNSGFQQKMRED